MTQPAHPPSVGRLLAAARGAAPDGPSDAELLGRFAASRDEAAFEQLVWRHGGMVHRTCRDILRDHHAAEDVTQAAFLVLARKARSIGRREAVAGWLYRVARRMAVRSAARSMRQPTATDQLGNMPAAATEPDDAAPHLLAELARLPEYYRLPILLCYFEGLTHAAAAERLDWPVGTVAGRLSRAKDVLRDRLSRRGITVPAVGVLAVSTAESTAAISPIFVNLTTRAAVAAAAGEPLTAIVSAHTAGLVKGTLTAMTGAKIQWAAGLAATCGLLAAGGAYVAAQGPGSGGPPPAQPSPGGGREGLSAPAEAAPAKGGAADAAQRRRSFENLKRILLAMHNYLDTHNRFPADIRSKDGKPLLSWRVELLPYMDQEALYKEFKRDEAWDSENNLRLLARMPDVFRVGFEAKGATHTYYQRIEIGGLAEPVPAAGDAGGPGAGGGAPGGAVFTPPPGPGQAGAGALPPAGGLGGAGSALPGPGGGPAGGILPPMVYRLPERITEITDGTSNTVGVVEAGPAVAWTKPENLRFAQYGTPPKLILPFSNTLNVAMYDGSASSLKPGLDAATMAMLIGPSDGFVLPESTKLRARFPVETAAEKAELQKKLDESKAVAAEIERELKEHVRLVGTRNGGISNLDKADEEVQNLRTLLEALKAKNQDLRTNLGLRK